MKPSVNINIDYQPNKIVLQTFKELGILRICTWNFKQFTLISQINSKNKKSYRLRSIQYNGTYVSTKKIGFCKPKFVLFFKISGKPGSILKISGRLEFSVLEKSWEFCPDKSRDERSLEKNVQFIVNHFKYT